MQVDVKPESVETSPVLSERCDSARAPPEAFTSMNYKRRSGSFIFHYFLQRVMIPLARTMFHLNHRLNFLFLHIVAAVNWKL